MGFKRDSGGGGVIPLFLWLPLESALLHSDSVWNRCWIKSGTTGAVPLGTAFCFPGVTQDLFFHLHSFILMYLLPFSLNVPSVLSNACLHNFLGVQTRQLILVPRLPRPREAGGTCIAQLTPRDSL